MNHNRTESGMEPLLTVQDNLIVWMASVTLMFYLQKLINTPMGIGMAKTFIELKKAKTHILNLPGPRFGTIVDLPSLLCIT